MVVREERKVDMMHAYMYIYTYMHACIYILACTHTCLHDSTISFIFQITDFADEAELLRYLQTNYQRAVEQDEQLLSYAQTVVSLTVHFMQKHNIEQPQVSF